MRKVLSVVAAMLAAGSAQAQPAADAKTVEALVAKIYAGYGPGGDPEDAAKALPFDDSLTKIIDRVEQVNSEGIGFDPFCACQDYEDIRATVKATSLTPQAATVVARFRNFDQPVSITYKLAMTPKGWRIQDMVLPEAPSFRELIIRASMP